MRAAPQAIPDVVERPPAIPVKRRTIDEVLTDGRMACEVTLPSGRTVGYGPPPPRFTLAVHSEPVLDRKLDEFSLGAAYVNGAFDMEGDMLAAMDARALLPDRVSLRIRLGFWLAVLARRAVSRNRAAIESHYSLGDDFYLTFIDRRYRFYSHGLFHSPDESLEDASRHKLETMFRALELRPGMRLLDIGAGWGGVAQYCGRRGVHVTGLTIAEDSYAFVKELIAREDLPAEIRLEDFLEHRPSEPYHAVVIYGVIEHIPNYRRFCERVWECLRPGGRLYVDASASRRKYSLSGYSRRFIWPGTHSTLCLDEFIGELLLHGMDVLEVQNETRDYELTMHHWARRFDLQRDAIIDRWGERVFRAFRLYLWGGCWAFRHDRMQAYHVVARRGIGAGPRPGLPGRFLDFLRSRL